ncbi:MAG: hypothetical protein IJ937_01955, partial [Treponema sp.]|nr:hypothetical protein [Treponema sp.]
MIKKLLLWIPSFILIFVVLLAVLLSVFEFKPEPIQDVPFSSGEKILQKNESYSILSWNIGYAGLGKYSDYFFVLHSALDGKTHNVRTAPRKKVFSQVFFKKLAKLSYHSFYHRFNIYKPP